MLAPDGARAEGAVVVSSAGGQAVTDGSGRFRLAVQVPRDAQSVQVTAVGRGATSLLGSAGVALFGPSGLFSVGSLCLAPVTRCPPSWLPTFGGQPGADSGILALAVFDDGSGPALFAGGTFTSAGGAAASRIAKWNGTTWSALGGGVTGGFVAASVQALAVFDDSSGAALYAGGHFGFAGGMAADHIAKWDGTSWTTLGSGLTGGFLYSFVQALAVSTTAAGRRSTRGGCSPTPAAWLRATSRGGTVRLGRPSAPAWTAASMP